MGKQQRQRQQRPGLPPEQWIEAVLQQLRQLLPRCTPAQLTTALWCLKVLRYKASVAWLDAVCDALLGQLQHCNMQQLQQLLRGLLYQGHVLAPARIDAVLNAALALALQGHGHYSEQQLVWLLKLAVLLHHEPEPEWTQQVAAAAAQRMVSSSGSSGYSGHSTSAGGSSSSSTGWSPELLTELLDGLSQLGAQDLQAGWAGSFRKAARQCLPHFTGLQLARLLSAMALARWQVGREAPRPFLQPLLRHVQQRMNGMDVHAIGLVGVAVGQIGLLMRPAWEWRFMGRVQQLARSRAVRVPVSDVGNLQRSVQYLRWCSGSRITKAGCCSSRLRLKQRKLRLCRKRCWRRTVSPGKASSRGGDTGSL